MRKSRKKKNKKPRVSLDEHRQEQLVRFITGQTRKETRYGVDRKERTAALGGAVIFF